MLCTHAAASSVARIALLFRLPAFLHRTHPSRPDDEAHSDSSSKPTRPARRTRRPTPEHRRGILDSLHRVLDRPGGLDDIRHKVACQVVRQLRRIAIPAVFPRPARSQSQAGWSLRSSQTSPPSQRANERYTHFCSAHSARRLPRHPRALMQPTNRQFLPLRRYAFSANRATPPPNPVAV